jgi:uncharacterized protein YbaR (Trm112 family)
MKKDILDILCCPKCRGELDLNIIKEEKGDIIEGKLTCKKCKSFFSIVDGIPNLLTK